MGRNFRQLKILSTICLLAVYNFFGILLVSTTLSTAVDTFLK